MMHERRKSDSSIVPAKSPNNDFAVKLAEEMEGRELVKGNLLKPNKSWAQYPYDLQNSLERIRNAAIRDKGLQFTTLWHHVYQIERRQSAFLRLKKNASPGIDKITWQEYEKDLEANLQDLSGRLQRGAYRARPVKRVYIPKPDGKQRPLGIPVLEDKIVQSATAEVLNAVYETDFIGISYGFRSGRSAHNALDAVSVGIWQRNVNWILDADIKEFFGSIDHELLMKSIEIRIKDKGVLRHIRKWLNAGVLEKGKITQSEQGTPQGGNISPLLANIFLHYVLDLWVVEWRQRKAQGDMIVVRYADDFIIGFQYEWEAKRFLREFKERLAAFKLELHPEKTRLIEFGRFAASNRARRGQGHPETFNFLGFTHSCDTTRNGKFIVLRQTMRQRMCAKLKEIKAWLVAHMHDNVAWVGKHLCRVIQGYMQYFAVPRNGPALRAFLKGIGRIWYKVLKRRSQKSRVTWKRMYRLFQTYFPSPKILHPYPWQRLCVRTQDKSRMR